MPRGAERLLAAFALLLACTTLCRAAPEALHERASSDTQHAARWVLDVADNAGRPFAIVDKWAALVSIFAPDGRLIGASAALLGADPGDRSVPDIAHRAPASLGPGERSTPAGRFETTPGHNDKGEDIVWFDYDAALAIHRLRPAPPHERRAQRLASPTADDNRISLGCIVVPVAFYESVVRPSLGRRPGVVYVLPEARVARAMFGAD